jgi:hypothetical protein
MNQDTSVIPHGLYCYHETHLGGPVVICPHYQAGKVPLCLFLSSPIKSPAGKKVCFLNMTIPDEDDEIITLN